MLETVPHSGIKTGRYVKTAYIKREKSQIILFFSISDLDIH